MSTIALRSFACLGLAAVLLAVAGARPAATVAGETVTKVTLKKRADNGPYGSSAYSFRYASQELDTHGNDVELVYSGCGSLHISPTGGSKNRIVRVDAEKLADVKEIPEKGWQTSCIAPEEGAVYLLQIEDENTKYAVKFVLTDVSEKAIKLEWAPLRDPLRGRAGTMGQCPSAHECE
jgi:hypothetical protein